MRFYIPENSYGIKPGMYELNGIVSLLRSNSARHDVVQFLADMMEV